MQPTREPTHPELDVARMMTIAGNLQDALDMRGESALTPELVEEIAGELGVRESHVYVAAATMSEIPCATGAAVEFTVCVGNCQRWGAVELLERVLDVDGIRRANDEPGFSVIAKRCLDRCADAPVIQIRTPDGLAGLAPAKRASLDEALDSLSG